MSYARDTWMFSQGQVELMLATLNASTFQGGRSDLKNSNVTVNCNNSVDLNEHNIDNLYVYPNPSKGNIFINYSKEIISASIYNIVGKKIASDIQTDNKLLDISHLSNGIYLITINTTEGIITKHVIISK